MVERRVSWEFLFVAFIITLTIMAGMFFMGKALSEEKVDQLTASVERLALERESQDLSRRLAANLPENNCKALRVAAQQNIEDLRQLRQEVGTYEDAQKIDNPDFTIVKTRYTTLLLEYWLTMEDIDDLCGTDITTLLYFYGDDENCPACEDQGTILTHYRRVYDQQLLVFPLDTTLGLDPVTLLQNAYEIDRYPAIVIDGEVYRGFKDKEALGSILQTYINTTEG